MHSTRKVARKAKVKVATWVYPSLHAKKKRGPRRRSKEINALKIAKQKIENVAASSEDCWRNSAGGGNRAEIEADLAKSKSSLE